MRDSNIYKSGLIFLNANVSYPVFKATADGEDVTAYVYSFEIQRFCTKQLSGITLNLDNYQGRFNEKFYQGAEIIIYLEYSDAENYETAVPTNILFKGKLDNHKRMFDTNGCMSQIVGREYPELVDMTGSFTFDSTNIKDAISSVIIDLNTKAGYTVISEGTIETTTESTSVTYRDQSYLSILSDLCLRAGFDSRINTDGTYDAFTEGSRKCYTESVVSGINLVSLPPAGVDNYNRANYIKTYGPEKEECLLMWTKKAASYSSTNWRKDMIVNDTSIQNLAELQDRANKEYDNLSDSDMIATPICTGMPYLREGDSIRAFVEYCGIDDYYVVKQITHSFSVSGFDTVVQLNQLGTTATRIMQSNTRDIREKSTFYNPNNMEYSYHLTFEDTTDIASQSNTSVSDGKLGISSGDSGTMTTNSMTMDNDIHYAEIRFNGSDDCALCTFEVSCDNGDTWQTLTAGRKSEAGTMSTITVPGKKVRFRINMNSTTVYPLPLIESCVCLFKE